jgi:hypothetical protein
MKGLTLAVLALCAATAGARVVILTQATAFHTDQWCADHHLGEGPSTCIQHDGCCYDGRIGICHSCDAHSDEWCETYGGDEVKTCVGYSGCTFSYDESEDGKCVSNSDPSSIVDEQTCEEALNAAIEAGTDEPECTANGEFEFEQVEADSGMIYCADENGHEIPDTRKGEAAFAAALTNCEKERKKHGGMQCPNAVTLSTGNGEVMINDHEDVGNCDVSCNTDKDCPGDDEWCCYNGCGYSCQVPIIPKADCQHLVLEPSESASDFSVVHGTMVTISCETGYSGSDPIEIECKHGSWSEYDMDCMKDCEPYRIVDGRERDYDISGSGNHHGASRKVKCRKDGYGAVAGSPDAMRFYKERIECINGAWRERTLECSVCFDAPNSGPHQWWTGITDGVESVNAYDCMYFASRPLKCSEFPEAQENCRVSCRTCEEALMKYKVKAVIDSKAHTKHPEKWLKKRVKLLNGFQPLVSKNRRVKVAHRVKKGDGSRVTSNVDDGSKSSFAERSAEDSISNDEIKRLDKLHGDDAKVAEA